VNNLRQDHQHVTETPVSQEWGFISDWKTLTAAEREVLTASAVMILGYLVLNGDVYAAWLQDGEGSHSAS
jgi:hypothetical protein